MLSISVVFSSSSCCRSVNIYWAKSHSLKLHQKYHWRPGRTCSTKLVKNLLPFQNLMASCNTMLQARIKQQISKFWDAERTCWRRRDGNILMSAFFVPQKRRGNVFTNFQLSALKCYLRKIISLRGIREFKLFVSCSNFFSNFCHDLGYCVRPSRVTCRKDS